MSAHRRENKRRDCDLFPYKTKEFKDSSPLLSNTFLPNVTCLLFDLVALPPTLKLKLPQAQLNSTSGLATLGHAICLVRFSDTNDDPGRPLLSPG